MSWESQLQALGCVAIAMILGAVLGAEREMAHKPAGLRTHMLISAASALLVALEDPIIWRFFNPATAPIVRADTLRILSAVITAVGFLGAGTIIRRAGGDRVEGLTTAASMLLAAIIGLATGLRQFPLAVGVTVLTLIALRGLLLVERKIRREMPRPPSKELS
ncbi:MAG TPA: MgtC/SapB family protein [Thermoanaerobaculia bacterium]|nr:MgtC/SapB family protein [Thermoanaerobaculia bacterium]